MKRSWHTMVAGAFSALLLFTATDTAGAEEVTGQSVEVRIRDMRFAPARIEIPSGTTVRWINEDPFDHDVTSGTVASGRAARRLSQTKFPDGRFQSGLFGAGKVFEFRFRHKGRHPYFCNIHPMMTGTVVVH